ncbi:MAG: phosphatidylglycerophosphatase A [Candidatus Omnitrophota bacterium]
MRNRTTKLIASLGFLGHSPFAPGTAGCLLPLALWFFIRPEPPAQIILLIAFLTAGFLVSGRAERLLGRKDPSQIVIDEAAGMVVTLLYIPFSIMNLAVGFVIFRLVDIAKPFPVKRSEKLPGGLGIMTDDILAGIYANLLLRLVIAYLTIFN